VTSGNAIVSRRFTKGEPDRKSSRPDVAGDGAPNRAPWQVSPLFASRSASFYRPLSTSASSGWPCPSTRIGLGGMDSFDNVNPVWLATPADSSEIMQASSSLPTIEKTLQPVLVRRPS